MSDDKQALNSSNENAKVFSGELFVANNSNENESESNNNSLRKSTSNSVRGSLTCNIRSSVKSNQSNNNERFLTHSLMQDLRGTPKKESDKRLVFDKLKIKDQQIQLNSTQLSNNSNNNSINNINEEDVLANIKLPKNDNNQQKPTFDDLYEDVNEDEGENEENKYANEENENEENNIENNNDQMDDNININQLNAIKL